MTFSFSLPHQLSEHMYTLRFYKGPFKVVMVQNQGQLVHHGRTPPKKTYCPISYQRNKKQDIIMPSMAQKAVGQISAISTQADKQCVDCRPKLG